MMKKKKMNLSRGIMLHEQWIEDGKLIGQLRLKSRWLARQLALAGVRPRQSDVEVEDSAETERLAEEWLAVAERVSVTLYGKQPAA